MIVLTKSQKTALMAFISIYNEKMNAEGLKIIPTEIKNGDFILPESVLSDERAADIRGFVLNNSVIRDVSENEFKPSMPPL